MDRMSSNLFLLSPLRLTLNSQHLSGVYDTSYHSYLRSVFRYFSSSASQFLSYCNKTSGRVRRMFKHAGFELYGLEKSGLQLHRGLQHE